MTATVIAIYRYPVKGLSAEEMDRVALVPGECLPHDRRFAVALGSTRFDPQHPEWLPKIRFVMLMRDEKLARLRTRFDAESGVLAIAENDRELLRAAITEPDGRRPGGGISRRFPRRRGRTAARRRGARARLCRCAAQAERDDRQIRLADQPSEHRRHWRQRWACRSTPALSRECLFRRRAGLSEHGGSAPRSPSERRGCGSSRAITRCAATQVNPVTAQRDLDIVAALERAFGHINMGVYAEVVAGGEISLGDALRAHYKA